MVKMLLFSVVAVAVVEAAAQEETVTMFQASRIISVDGSVSTQTGNVGGHSAAVGDGLGWTDSTWFNAQLAALKIEGEDIYADIKACMVQNPKESLVEAARESHSKCREAELGMVGMNLTKDCEDSKKSDCDEMQSTFELATCTHSASQAAFSKEVDACLTAASHVVTKTGVQLKEANLKEEFVHYKQFQCRMSKWPLTPEEKQECKNLDPDTSHLSVSYPSKPTTTQPAKLVDLPGDVAWLAGEYTSKNWSQLVKTSTSCTTTPAPVDILSGLPARDFNVCPSTDGLWEKATWVLGGDGHTCKESCTALGKTCNKDTLELTNRVCTFAALQHILQSPTLQLVPTQTYANSWTTAIVNKRTILQGGCHGGHKYLHRVPQVRNSDSDTYSWYQCPQVPVPTDDARCSDSFHAYQPSSSYLCACV